MRIVEGPQPFGVVSLKIEVLCDACLGYAGNRHLQKERSPGSLPGFVWFRVPKLAPQFLANSGGGLELHLWWVSARWTTETFPGACAAARLSNLQSSRR